MSSADQSNYAGADVLTRLRVVEIS